MKRALLAALLVILAIGAVVGIGARRAPEERARRDARVLYDRARAAYARGESQREFTLLLEALSADPTYTSALVDLTRNFTTTATWSLADPRLEEAISAVPDSALADCMRKVILATRELSLRIDTTGASPAVRECALVGQLISFSSRLVRDADLDAVLALWRKYPESWSLPELVMGVVTKHDRRLAREIALQMLDQSAPITTWLIGNFTLNHLARTEGNDSAAERLDREGLARLAREPAALRYMHVTQLNPRAHVTIDSVATLSDRIGRLSFYVGLGHSAYNNGRLPASLELWNRILKDYTDLPEMVAYALMYRGRTYMKAGDLARAEADLLAARTAAAPLAHMAVLVESDHNLFHVYEAQGRRAEALAAGRGFIARSNVPNRLPSRMMSHHDVGWYYWRLGEYEKARAQLSLMLTKIDTLGLYRHYAGEYYERTGDLERAMRMYELADSVDLVDARSIARRALIAAQMGDSAKAIRLAKEHDARFDPQYPEFTPILPEMLANFGQPATALIAATRADSLAQSRHQAAAMATLKLQRARLQLRLGRPLEARVLADSATLLAQRVAAFETEILARATAAVAMTERGDVAGRDTLEALLRNAASERQPQLRLQLYTMLGDAYGDSDSGSSHALSAYRKAAALNDTIASSMDSDAARAQLRSAKNDVSGRALTLIVTDAGRSAASSYSEWSTRRKAQGISSARSGRAPAWSPQTGEAVIDYVVLDTLVAALVMTADRTETRVLPVKPQALLQMVRAQQEELTPRIGALVNVARSRFRPERAHELYRDLIEPLLADLAGIDRLVIIPDGPLHYLAFDALVTSSAGPPKYLVERYDIRFAPSLGLMRAAPPTPRGVVLVFTGAAAAAEAEVAAITGHSSERLRVMPVAPSASTEARVRSFSRDASIVHFAAHAVTNDRSPLFAHLALRGDGSDDGNLHAFEIEKLDLSNALIILSGCDTGRGYLAGGEGVLSLSRAFLRAGAIGTVATLWPVGAGSPEFMAEFYRQMALGLDPAAALRQAKLHALKGRFASPLYWAPFVLMSA